MSEASTSPKGTVANGLTVTGLRNYVEFAIRKEQQRLTEARTRAEGFELPPDEAAIDAKDELHKARMNASREYRQADAARESIRAESAALKDRANSAGTFKAGLLRFASNLLARRAAVYGTAQVERAAARIPAADIERETARLVAGRDTRRKQHVALLDAAVAAEGKLGLVQDRLLKVWQLERLGVDGFGDKHLPQVNDAVIESTLRDAAGRAPDTAPTALFGRLSACHRQMHFAAELLPTARAAALSAEATADARALRDGLLRAEGGEALLKAAPPALSEWLAAALPPPPADSAPPPAPPLTRRRALA